MGQRVSSGDLVRVEVSNIGGIDATEVELEPGVNVLAGRNATNRTSFLTALMAALGSDNVAVKGDADRGRVELTIGDRTYSRTFTRKKGSTTSDGEAFLSEPELADLFAFLLETNDARRAVALDDDLREIIMRPVDIEAIQTEQEQLQAEKREVSKRLDELESLNRDLPPLEERRTELDARIEEKRAELEAKNGDITSSDAELDGGQAERSELDERIAELKDVRSELDEVEFRLKTERTSRESTHEEYVELQETYDDLPEADAETISEIERRIDDLHEEKQTVDSHIAKLQNLIRVNEEFIDGDGELLELLRSHDAETSGSVTDRLLEDDTRICWTCGSEITTSRMERTLDRLREVTRDKQQDRSALERRLEERKSERDELDAQRQERVRIERRLDSLGDELDEREEIIEQLEDRRASLDDRIETLEDEIETLEEEDHGELLDLHKVANRLEFEIDRLETERAEIEDEIGTIEERLADRDELEARHAEIRSELADLRTKIDRIEEKAVAAFNTHMDEILEILEYRNIERIWIERTTTDARDGRRQVTESAFELHVVRTTDAGSTYEDTLDHLSESEREVTGLIFALAGYLVHDIHDLVPFVLLDSLEALDSDRIAALIEYFDQYATYVVAALLPEDSAALNDEHHRVPSI